MTIHFESLAELPEYHREKVAQTLAMPSKSGKGQPKNKNKYGSIKTVYKGVLFDSRKEAKYAEQLDLELKAGSIQWWCYHPKFLLQAQNLIYEADFVVMRGKSFPFTVGIAEVIDVKSKATKTASYRIKKKLLKETYGIEIKEI